MPFGNHFLQEHIVHVAQREQPEAQEEQSLLFPSVSEVVVPQSQHRKGSQNHHPQEEMPGSHTEEDGQEDERRNDANVNFFGSSKPRNSEAIRDCIHDSFTSLRLHGFTRNPPIQKAQRENASYGFAELETTGHCISDSRLNDKRDQRPSILLPTKQELLVLIPYKYCLDLVGVQT